MTGQGKSGGQGKECTVKQCVMRGGTPLGLTGILALERDCQALRETVSLSARGVPCPGGYEPCKGAPSVGCGGAPPAAASLGNEGEFGSV